MNAVIARLSETIQVDYRGNKYEVFSDDYIGKMLLLDKDFEIRSIAAAVDLAGSTGTIVDIGANVGLFTVLLSANPALRIYSFEPNSRVYQLLIRNLLLNHRANVSAICCGLSNRTTLAQLDTFMTRNIGATRVCSIGSAAGMTSPICALFEPGTAFETLGIDEVKLMKIDVEGHEPEVLKSIGWNSKFRPKALIIEFMPQLAIGVDVRREIWTILTVAGYKAYCVNGLRVKSFDIDKAYPDGNLVFVDE